MYSRAAWETWQDIFDAVASGLIEPFVMAWGLPESPWVIETNKTDSKDET